MEQRYNISGTYDELQMILEKEFSISSDSARILTAILVFDQNQEYDQTQLEEDTLWFLKGGQDDYQSRFFSTRYTISFSKAMLDVLDELSVPIILAVFGFEEIAICSEILYGIKALVKNARRIRDNECCVYFQILQYLKAHSERWFSAEQVKPNIGEEAICINLDKGWKCTFRCGESCENCNIKLKDVKDILDTFCRDSIIEPNEEKTLYKFRT